MPDRKRRRPSPKAARRAIEPPRASGRVPASRSDPRLEAEVERRVRALVHDLFNQAPAGIAILRGPDHVYELSNPINSAGLGKDPTGLPLREAFPEAVAQGYVAVLDRVYETGEPFVAREAPIRVQNLDGSFRDTFVDLIYTPMRNLEGHIEGILIFGFDVTEKTLARRKAENNYRDLQERERAKAEAIKVRDDFLTIAGHELRTPLSALQLQVQSLQRLVLKDGVPAGRVLERLQKMEHHVGRLENLVSDLLNVSRITAGRLDLQLETVELVSLVADVVERFAPQLAAARCKLRIDGPKEAYGEWDRLRLDQVITNILGNAIKYGAGEPIEVTISATDEQARLVVRDHGIGIPLADQRRIFERFERAVSDRQYGGLGLGLWITRQMVEAHRGTIRFESTPEDGTTFVVELPRSRRS